MAAVHRFFVTDPEAIGDSSFRLTGGVAHQVRAVLRLRPGEHIWLLDNRGQKHLGVLEELGRTEVRGTIVERQPVTSEPDVTVHLFQALLPREKFEWVLQKGTEVGVKHFWPVLSQRSLVRSADSLDEKRMSRWRAIIREAAEQANRGLLPEIHPPLPLARALAAASSSSLLLFLWEQEQGRSLSTALSAVRERRGAEIAVFIGPEGGFDEAEAKSAIDAGAAVVSLGPRILRAETAGIVVAAIVLYELGEMAPDSPGAALRATTSGG